MPIQKPNIKKAIDAASQKKASEPKQQKDSGPGGLMDSPMFNVAKGALTKLTPKWRAIIGGAVYLIFMGMIATIYLIVKLIMLAF